MRRLLDLSFPAAFVGLDRALRCWFAQRAIANKRLGLMVLCVMAAGWALMLSPAWLHAPSWVSYVSMATGVVLIVLSHLALLVYLDAIVVSLPHRVLNWLASNHVGLPSPVDHRAQALSLGWVVPRHVGLLEDWFLRRRLTAEMESRLNRWELDRAPRAQGRLTPPRL